MKRRRWTRLYALVPFCIGSRRTLFKKRQDQDLIYRYSAPLPKMEHYTVPNGCCDKRLRNAEPRLPVDSQYTVLGSIPLAADIRTKDNGIHLQRTQVGVSWVLKVSRSGVQVSRNGVTGHPSEMARMFPEESSMRTATSPLESVPNTKTSTRTWSDAMSRLTVPGETVITLGPIM